jgi:STE24 endopeptidase
MGFLTSPIGSAISRKFEYEADCYAINTTKNFSAFSSTMEKLASQNLSDTEPNALAEFWFHPHPSISKRIKAAERCYERVKTS